MPNPIPTTAPLCPVPVVGLIGGIGSGKSAVANWVAARHPVLVIDGDQAGHRALDNPDVQLRLRQAFGDGVFDASGRVIRSALSRVVFGGEETHRRARSQLEQILHPAIREDIEGQLRDVNPSTHQYVLLDAAVMLEAGWSGVCDTVVFLDTPVAVRRERVAARGWAPSELDRREASQWPLERKREAATSVIANTGALDDAGAALWRILQQVSQN
jgi:dephospho-CoA kinase